MSNLAIRAENLSKLYRIGSRVHYKTLRASLHEAMYAPFRRLSTFQRSNVEPVSGNDTIWALKDVSFEVKRGQVVGFIGPNGAGKTTLLRILSRITEPTAGRAEIHGRVGALLQVGTGFHPELTGRENIYLNGAILGMKRADIERRFDEIVAFAGTGKFLDTPVKRYSRGMRVRLAFSVAAHLNPEILLVDEVLAVGDAAFKQKCQDKIEDVVSKEWRTIVLVSHNMLTVQRLCGTVYLLEQGRVTASGDAATVIDAYYKSTTDRDNDLGVTVRDVPEGTVRFLKWQLDQSSTGEPYSCFTGEPCTFRFQLGVQRIVDKASIEIALWSTDDTLVWAMRSRDNVRQRLFLSEGLYEVEFALPQLPLKPGSYRVRVSVDNLREGNVEAWNARPELQILPGHKGDLSPEGRGILNIRGEFRLARANRAGEYLPERRYSGDETGRD